MKTHSSNYVFSPLCHDGLIYTADYSIWTKNKDVTTQKFEQYSFCPSSEEIVSILKSSNDYFVILALTELRDINPPGSQDVYLQLEEIENQNDIKKLIEVGFDVVDQWTGISVLTNVGYLKNEVVSLLKLNIKTNQFGLLTSIDDTNKFIAFASDAVPEHLPLIAVKILKNSNL